MLEVSRTKRFLAFLINYVTINGLIIGGIYCLVTKRTSLGGLVIGYKFEGGSLFKLFLFQLLTALLYVFTFYIMFIVDAVGMGKRNGTLAENWSDTRKVWVK